MIYTSCGHNQYDFRNVYTTREQRDQRPVEPRWLHLCRKCYEIESTRLFKITEFKHAA